MKMKHRIQVAGAMVVANLGIAQTVAAADLLVPETYGSIQDAVYAAAVGDRILVAPGTYPGFDFTGKNVEVLAVAGMAVTNITSTVTMTTGVLDGFSIQAPYPNALGVSATGGGLIRRCRVHDIHRSYWGIWRGLGMQLRGAVTVRDCIVENNSGGVYNFGGVAGAGIYVGRLDYIGGTTIIEGTVIRNNAASWYYGPSGGGVAVGFEAGSSEATDSGASVILRNCVLYGNSSGGCDQLKNFSSSCTLENSFIIGQYCSAPYWVGVNFVGVSRAMATMTDCNSNGVPDQWDCISGTSLDVDGDYIPDECQDCDHDGVCDVCELVAGTATDVNHNGIPDNCECLGDLYVDHRVDGADLGPLLAYWGPVTDSAASRSCDLNVDGRVDGFDLGVLLNSWGPCPN